MVALYETTEVPHPHDQCQSRDGWHGPTCNLEQHHDGDHAEVSLSGLVIHMWPAIYVTCEFCGDRGCDCGEDW